MQPTSPQQRPSKISSKQLAAELAGWYGTGAILAAYALLSFKIIDNEDLAYQLLNLSGAMGIIVIGVYKNVPQSIVLNLVWSAIAIVAIAAIIF